MGQECSIVVVSESELESGRAGGTSWRLLAHNHHTSDENSSFQSPLHDQSASTDALVGPLTRGLKFD